MDSPQFVGLFTCRWTSGLFPAWAMTSAAGAQPGAGVFVPLGWPPKRRKTWSSAQYAQYALNCQLLKKESALRCDLKPKRSTASLKQPQNRTFRTTASFYNFLLPPSGDTESRELSPEVHAQERDLPCSLRSLQQCCPGLHQTRRLQPIRRPFN